MRFDLLDLLHNWQHLRFEFFSNWFSFCFLGYISLNITQKAKAKSIGKELESEALLVMQEIYCF